MSDLASSLSRLAEISQKLNNYSDRASPLIRALDKYLADLNIGCEVWLRSFYREVGRNCQGHYVSLNFVLGFGRDEHGHYRLVVRCDGPMTDESGREITDEGKLGSIAVGSITRLPKESIVWVRSLQQCSRELRLAALSLLPELVAEMLRVMEGKAKYIADEYRSVEVLTNDLAIALKEAQAEKK